MSKKKSKPIDFRSEKLYREIKSSKVFGSLAEYLKEHKADILEYKPPRRKN